MAGLFPGVALHIHDDTVTESERDSCLGTVLCRPQKVRSSVLEHIHAVWKTEHTV